MLRRGLFSYHKKFFSNLINYSDKTNPRVYFSIEKDGKNIGRLSFELYANHCPKTAENFRQLCTGENKLGLSYKGNVFHRIINGFMAQGGDITKGDGTGGQSIYGRTFRDENLKLKHFKRGLLSMANSGPDTNGSQFFITFTETPWLNGYHCVFGEVVEGENVLAEIERAGTQSGKPAGKIKVVDCGELNKNI